MLQYNYSCTCLVLISFIYIIFFNIIIIHLFIYIVPFNDDEYISIIMDKLKDATAEWKLLGLQLGVSHKRIKEINDNPGVAECLVDLLVEWVTSKPKEATIQKIIDALKSIDDYALADEVKATLIDIN